MNHLAKEDAFKIAIREIEHSAAVKAYEHWKNCKQCQKSIFENKKYNMLYKLETSTNNSEILQRNIYIDNFNIKFSYSEYGIQEIFLNPRRSENNQLNNIQDDQLTFVFGRALGNYFQGHPLSFNQIDPIKINTDFRRDVLFWTSLIPFGKIVNYGKIGKWLNKNCAQAIGQALTRNPLPILIPCHRVIGKNGDLTGFASGLDMKRKLLQIEKY